MIEQRVTLRYGAQQIPAIVQAVQGDTGRDVIFELADYEIPAGATANYYIDKPDGDAVYNSAEVISSTEILAHLTEQALAVPGRNNGQVRILADDEVITSFDFVLEVEAFRGILRLQSETEINIFDQAIEDAVNTATEEAVAEIQAQTPVVTGMQDSIAPTYNASSTYAVGDYVMYNAQLYKCVSPITTAEAWTAAHWIHVPIAHEVSDLNSHISDIESRFDNPNVLSGVVGRDGLAVASGQVINAGSNDAHCIQFDVEPNTQYRLVMPIANRSGFTGNNTGVFEAGQTYTAFSASITYPTSYVFTTPANITSVLLYFYAGTYSFDPSDFALYKGASIPEDTTVRLKQANLPTQIPYSSIVGVEVTKEETDFIEKVEGINRFNKADATQGAMLNANGTITTLSSQAYVVSGYVPVEAETQYSIYCGAGDAGQYASGVYVTVQMYDSSKTRIGNAVGTEHTGYYTVTTLADAAFARVNIYNSLDVFMIVKGSTYPVTYSPFSDRYVLDGVEESSTGSASNPLYGKTILWNGDSICAGKAFNDTHDAWAGRIASANNMIYKNYAVGGGTITENVQQGGITKHSVCATLATMYAEMPDADYIVFDGGCNDADLLGDMITGTPERLGTFNMSDFSGDYDEDTFCGAFESILYRMTNYWRNAKFAYIIPHKMGILNEYRTDYTKAHHNYRAYYDLAIQMCEKWGVKYLDLWDNCFFCPMITHMCDTYSTMTQQEIYDAGFVYADRQHLTQHGYDIEAPMIENWLKTI